MKYLKNLLFTLIVYAIGKAIFSACQMLCLENDIAIVVFSATVAVVLRKSKSNEKDNAKRNKSITKSIRK